ncbi:MAG TPA: acyltransferase family protein [Xanthomonadaceae bacterium]|nr:acyltransferase family protein [Xanthomonadaceae bacterium]
MTAGQRYHYLDNLRALAMLGGVLFHAALAYSPLAHPLFPTADRDNTVIVDLFAWFLHLFRMPLFFVVAGFFTALQVQRRGLGGMFRNRLLRIGLPFLLFVPLVHLSLTWSTLHAVDTVAHPSPLLALIRTLREAGPLSPHPPGTSHLWFLYYLMLFLVLLWVARSFELGGLGTRIAALHPAFFIGVLPVLLAPALASVPAPHPAPESFLPQFWALAYYGAFFALGYLMHGHPQLISRLRPHAHALLAGSLLLYAVFTLLLAHRPPELAGGRASWSIALIEGAISVWMTIVCLVFGQALLDRSHRVLRYIADASYWIYIVHLPILFAIQYRLLDAELHWAAKLALSVSLTLAVCLLGYQLLVRPTPLARMLGGRSTQRHRTA